MPVRMFIRVDFPAPFSPSRAWISPGHISRSTSWLATTPGKYLAMPFSCTSGGVPGASRWCSAGSGIATTMTSSEPGDAGDRPVPVVKLALAHAMAGRDLDVTLGVLDLADKGRPAAEDLLAHRV